MKRLKFTEEQIIAILREQEAVAKAAEVCGRHGISGATFSMSGRLNSAAWSHRRALLHKSAEGIHLENPS